MKSYQVLSFSRILIFLLHFQPSIAFYISHSECAQRSRFRLTTRVPQPIQSLVSQDQDQETQSSLDMVWLTYAEVDALSTEIDQRHEEITAFHTDVAFYDDHGEEGNGNNINSGKPSNYRLNRHSKLPKRMAMALKEGDKDGGRTPVPIKAKEATEVTLRWCDEFVRELNLCPWAKLSLQSENGIRIKIVHQSTGIEAMERVIRESAQELVRMTDTELGGDVDVNAGITFVVAILDRDSNGGGCSREFQFKSFYDFCIDLEDRLFDEVDEAEETRGDNVVEGAMVGDVLIGDEVTIAPFHPDWYFATGAFKDDLTAENPLNYEKKSPYPTISLVRTSAIEQAGEEATNRIGAHNEEILKKFGVQKLEKLYNDKVLRAIDKIK